MFNISFIYIYIYIYNFSHIYIFGVRVIYYEHTFWMPFWVQNPLKHPPGIHACPWQGGGDIAVLEQPDSEGEAAVKEFLDFFASMKQ